MRMGRRLPNSVQIGEAIRKIRTAEQPKVSIEALALASGVDKSYLTEIQLGKRPKFSWEKMRVVVEALDLRFDVDLDGLIEVALTMPPDTKLEADETEV
jgi:transcriptional regulator with XRE-family HTH domain